MNFVAKGPKRYEQFELSFKRRLTLTYQEYNVLKDVPNQPEIKVYCKLTLQNLYFAGLAFSSYLEVVKDKKATPNRPPAIIITTNMHCCYTQAYINI